MKTLFKLEKFMGKRRVLLPVSIVFSAVSAFLSVLPFIFIWLIVKEFLLEDVVLSSGFGLDSSVVFYAVLAFLSAFLSVVLYFVALCVSHLAAFRVEVNIRRFAMRKIVSFPLGFFERNPSGKVRKVIDDNASITHEFLAHQLPDLAGTFLIPIFTLGLLFFFDWRFGLACLVPIFLAFGILSFMMGGRGKEFMKEYMNSLEEMNSEAVEYVRGIPVVKVFEQTIFSFKNFYKSIMDYKRMVLRFTLIWEKPMSSYVVLVNGIVFFLVPVAILIIGSSQNVLGVLIDLIFYILITPIFAQNIMRSMHLEQAFGQAFEAISRIEKLVDVKPLRVLKNPKKFEDFKESDRLDVVFDKVSFKYPDANRFAVEDVSFRIGQGKKVALVGGSGSGKSTIAKLIPRFWDVDVGEVRIGGVKVCDFDLKDLMRNVSFVFQSTKLFKGTLLENIVYGSEDSSSKQIQRAIDLAQCREIVEKLPSGLDTLIGSSGVYLSGGEMQRVALARAILKDAPFVVLDEATAFTDPENEFLIKKAFDELMQSKTVLMIAHRLSSVVDCDEILVLDDGRIVERGSHKELLLKRGVYFKMWSEYKKSAQWSINDKSLRSGEKSLEDGLK